MITYLLLGILTGVASGLFGIGGATILIPALIYIFGFTQHQAQGTTLAIMVLPIGLLAALNYYRAGDVKLDIVGIIALGFFIGGFFGAEIAYLISGDFLRRLVGVFFLMVSIKMIFF